MHGRAAGLIMQEGERGDEMYIVERGIVQVTVTNYSSVGQRVLGKLKMNDVFGEIGALVEESPGRALPRMRTAFAITHDCRLLSLSFSQLLKLRSESWSIDVAVGQAAAKLQEKRRLLLQDKKKAIRKHVNFEHFAHSTMKKMEQSAKNAESIQQIRTEIDTMNAKLDNITAMLQAQSSNR